ncbi:class I glutamine amidotransferase-like protein [Xylogone sp. PMI_703]|nr:class I glutamine amidotransferase-like protein [Xylogone sp. PMI_703]
MTTPKVLIAMADYGHDPTETAVPYTAFKKAGFEVHFATERGATPACDKKMLQGITQKLLGANRSAVKLYKDMTTAPEFQSPLSWSASGFSLAPYNLVFLPGGHEKSVRQIIDNPLMHQLLRDYFPQTKRPSDKAVAAICHGVMVLSETLVDGESSSGKSVLAECVTTALPARMEQVAFWGTRLFLGDYYKTYGAGSEDVEDSVRKRLNNPDQFKSSLGMNPFVVVDPKYNYLSARFPPDAQLLADKAIELVMSSVGKNAS